MPQKTAAFAVFSELAVIGSACRASGKFAEKLCVISCEDEFLLFKLFQEGFRSLVRGIVDNVLGSALLNDKSAVHEYDVA